MKKNIFFLTIAITLFTNGLSFAQDVKGKLVVGYQGWFACEGDNSPRNKWVHWSGGSAPAPGFGNSHFDLYPDVREYTKTYQTSLDTLGNGKPAEVFSSYDDQTVNTHFKWMQTYGIDCAALQRFGNEIDDYPSNSSKIWRDSIASKVKRAAEKHERKFYMMYDVTGMNVSNFITVLKNDWTKYLSNTSSLNLLSSPAYAKEMVGDTSKPVVCIWGVGMKGFSGNVYATAAQWKEIINWFKYTKGCYVILGVPREWRSETDQSFYILGNMLSPWNVGNSDAAIGYATTMQLDLAKCNEYKNEFQPVLYPGFSWANWKDLSPDPRPVQNQIPRKDGNFMWSQFYNVKSKGIKNVYVAMFDEYDEGTAIAKAAENASMKPTNQWFLSLDADGVACSADFYLRLVGDGIKMIRDEIPTTNLHPTRHSDDPSLAVTSVTLSLDSLTLIKDSTKRLTATVLPSNADNKIIYWSSDNSAVASIYNGLVTAKKVGTANIIATTLDGAKKDTTVVTVIIKTVIIDTVPSTINDFKYNTIKQSVNLYPNPLYQDVLTLKLDGYEESGCVEVTITNLQGQRVYQNKTSNSNTLQINTSGLLKSSVYFVSVKSGKSIFNSKLIVK